MSLVSRNSKLQQQEESEAAVQSCQSYDTYAIVKTGLDTVFGHTS